MSKKMFCTIVIVIVIVEALSISSCVGAEAAPQSLLARALESDRRDERVAIPQAVSTLQSGELPTVHVDSAIATTPKNIRSLRHASACELTFHGTSTRHATNLHPKV